MSTVAPSVWQELAALAHRDPCGRSLLDRLLALWSAERGTAGAALYLEREGVFHRQGAAAGPAFPSRLDQPAAAGFAVMKLPGGLLLEAEPVTDPSAGGALEVPLILALQGCVLREQLKEHRFQMRYRGVELEALYDVGLAIASTLDLEPLSEEILLRAVSLLDARRGALYLLEEEIFRLDRTFGGPARLSFPAELGASLSEEEAPAVAAGELLPEARHLLAARVSVDDEVRGLLVVADKESRSGVGSFGAADRRTLSLFANQAAIALENARLYREALEKERLERDLDLAAQIQRQILPARAPEVPGYDLLGWSRPARQVGGDYYDLLALPGERLRLVLGDVSGKGMPAALLVSTLHSALRLLAGRGELAAESIERLNRHVAGSSAAHTFITLLVGELSPGTGRLAYVNAGHNPALLLRRGGGVEELGASGVPVGLMPTASYERREVELAPGDLLCLYSDGITEAGAGGGEELGVERLVGCLEENRRRPLEELVEEVERRVAEHAGDCPQEDDQTLVLLRRRR